MTGKFVLITGCDSGIGLLSVKTFRKTNAQIISLCLTDEGSRKALSSGASFALKCDLSLPLDIDSVIAKIKLICKGTLWSIVHNAGGIYVL
jgi:NAD(P)-dependent dehydrogenase (short-subunit alcohol dehydrogenase family)